MGFNEDEAGQIVFEGMNPHIAAGRIPLNTRFGQPGRGYGQHEEHLFPAYESPFTWMPVRDPVAGRTAWLLERCRKTNTCPKIIQTVSSTEYWQGRMSLDTTDALGRHDVGLPDDVRLYFFSSTQHVVVPGAPSLGICQQLSNPNQYIPYLRALLVAFEHWVLEGGKPPPTTVVVGRDYVVLVPKVDADGNEVAGIRSTTIQAPLGTYTGWNLRRAGFAEDELCGIQGTFIPFAKTQTEREATGDPRPSLEERYGNHAGYVGAVQAAAGRLVAQRFLLPEDAERLIAEALRLAGC